MSQAATDPFRLLPPLPAAAEDAQSSNSDRFDLAAAVRGTSAPLVTALRKQKAGRLMRAALRLEDQASGLTDTALTDRWQSLSYAAKARRITGAQKAERLAVLREHVRRETGMLAYPVQLLAATALADRTAVEMATGEGKTLVTAMGAALQAAEGWPVHVITSNEYLALRDLDLNAALFARLGLTAGGIDPEMEQAERRNIYARDIVYAASKEVAFDHLRDRIALGDASALTLKLQAMTGTGAEPVMRGLWSAIVDEADSVLIDEARTPLVISAPGGDPALARIAVQAVRMAQRLRAGPDFTLDPKGKRPVKLTDMGKNIVRGRADLLGGVWTGERRATELAERALYALHVLQRDAQYIIREGKAEIVDENTGRIMPDRTWSDGLHQMVEVKEGLEPSADRVTLGRLTFQRFFRRYKQLSGLSGTLVEARRELKEIYDLAVMPVPTHRPSQRRVLAAHVFATAEEKWSAVAEAAKRYAEGGQPVLIGARTVGGAEAASAALTAQGIAHRVLSARQDAQEADVVAHAGVSGTVTVATNMAGRGTDIALDDAAREAGGLVVLMTERHESARVDRQLIGRCARQGAPGLVETYLAADDDIFGANGHPSPRVADFDAAQRRIEDRHRSQRADLNRMEEGLDDMIAFAGGLE